VSLYLVRHGRPVVDPGRDASEWELDPAGFDDVWALRESGRLPSHGAWFTSPERKAVATAQLLTDADVAVVDGLREHVRHGWQEDFHALVQQAFAEPDSAASEGWEPLATCRERVAAAVRGILVEHADEDVVLVGHGTAWTLVVAELTGAPPDLDRWRTMAFPDVIVADPGR
jgi:broad specificity phosphatase PhoE